MNEANIWTAILTKPWSKQDLLYGKITLVSVMRDTAGNPEQER